MKIVKFIGSILKDLFVNLYYLIKGVLLTGLLLGVASLILMVVLFLLSIIPIFLKKLGFVNLASIVLITEISIGLLFMIDINIFKLPKSIIGYIKNKWKEIK